MPRPITPMLKSMRLDGSGTAETGVARKPWKASFFLKSPDDPARVVDAKRTIGKPCAGHVDSGEAATAVEEAVPSEIVKEIPDYLSRVVDAVGLREECAGHVDSGKAAADFDEAMDVSRCVLKEPNDLSRVVDAKGLRRGHPGNVEGGEAAATVEEAVSAAWGVLESPDDLSGVVDALGPRRGSAGHVDGGKGEGGGVCGRGGGKHATDRYRRREN